MISKIDAYLRVKGRKSLLTLKLRLYLIYNSRSFGSCMRDRGYATCLGSSCAVLVPLYKNSSARARKTNRAVYVSPASCMKHSISERICLCTGEPYAVFFTTPLNGTWLRLQFSNLVWAYMCRFINKCSPESSWPFNIEIFSDSLLHCGM